MAKTVVRRLSTSQGITRTPYAPGFYKVRVTTGVEKESRKGNQMFVHESEILEAPEQPNDRKVKGKKLTFYFPITDSDFTVDKLKDFTNACGLRIASDDGYDPAKAIGKEVWVDMGMGTGSQGTPQAQANKFYSEEAYSELAAEVAADDD